MNYRYLIILGVISLLIIQIPTVSSVTISTDIVFQAGNRNFTVYQTMDFEQILIDIENVTFNNTLFNITSPNNINITLVYLNDNIAVALNDERILEFIANTTSGSVEFNISGFPIGRNYSIEINGTETNTSIANLSGFINFTNSDWSNQTIIIQQNQAGQPTADFTFRVEGSNIYVTSTSSNVDSETCYKWESSDDGVIYGSSGWICDTSGLTYTFTYEEGGTIRMKLTVKNDELTDTIEKVVVISSEKDKYPPENYGTPKSCDNAGYYWYNGRCNKDPKELPWNKDRDKELPGAGEHDISTITIGQWEIPTIYIILAFFVLIGFWYIKRDKKRRNKK